MFSFLLIHFHLSLPSFVGSESEYLYCITPDPLLSVMWLDLSDEPSSIEVATPLLGYRCLGSLWLPNFNN